MMLVISSTKSSYKIAYVNVIYKEGKKTVFYKYIYKIFSYLLNFRAIFLNSSKHAPNKYYFPPGYFNWKDESGTTLGLQH